MAKRNNNPSQANTGGNLNTEFGAESTLSKKARKQAARALKNNK